MHHWLRAFRNQVLLVAAFALELVVAECLQQRCGDDRKGQIVELTGKSGKRACRRTSLSKLQLLRRLDGQDGSRNTIMQAISGSREYASVVAKVECNLYSALAKETLGHAIALSFSWDGGGYSGLSVNIGMAIDCCTLAACHVRPGVAA